MKPDVLIVGQGLAGSLLAWKLERTGIPFEIVDRGHATAASAVAAGIINPITGRRLVKSWRVEALFPAAGAVYQEIGDAIGRKIWQPMRVRRLFADKGERATFAAKQRTGELAPFVAESDAEGFWIQPAARVDLPVLLRELRQRWLAQKRLRCAEVNPSVETDGQRVIIDCRGLGAARGSGFEFVPWEFSKGEILEVQTVGLQPDVIVNQREWIVPSGPDTAWVGATHEPGAVDTTPSVAGRAMLERRAGDVLRREFVVRQHLAGIRVTLPDKLPVIGWHPERAQLGLINGLGAKGALFAPSLADAWVAQLESGRAFDAAVDVRRFGAAQTI